MIRAPLVNSALNVARTVRQLLARRNAFEEAVGGAVKATGTPAPLEARSLASSPLWLLSLARARRALTRAEKAGDQASARDALVRLGTLAKLGETLCHLKVCGPRWLAPLSNKLATRWYLDAVRKSVATGLVVPGTTPGVPAQCLLAVRVEKATSELMAQEADRRRVYQAAVQKGLAGSGHLHMSDEELPGLTDDMKSLWASAFGSKAVWRSKKYRVPIGRDAMARIMDFCQSADTRRRMHDAYYAGFGPEVDEAALELLRTRQKLARRLGFKSWAEYQMRPLSVGTPAAAHQLMDRFWSDAEPSLAPVLKRMEQLSASRGGGSSAGARGGGDGIGGVRRLRCRIDQADEPFYRSIVSRGSDAWKLAQFLPGKETLPKILGVVGRAYNVDFQEIQPPDFGTRIISGWHQAVRIYQVTDGAPGVGGATRQQRILGHVYLDLYQRQSLFGRPAVELAGAMSLCPGHAYVGMNLIPAGYGMNKLLNPEEVAALAHELGHAVHMLCFKGSFQEFDDLPLDVAELPSTLVETIAMHPGVVSQYARHYATKGPPPEELVRSVQWDAHFFLRNLQGAHVVLGLHGEAFDAEAATAAELRAAARSFWQRYSAVEASPSFTPLGEDAGLHLLQGAHHVAYLLCYLRVDTILHGARASDGLALREREAAQRWLSPDFAGRVRAQLLERVFPGQRLAALQLPPGAASAGGVAGGVAGGEADAQAAQALPPHPLPQLAAAPALLMGRAASPALMA